MDKSDNSGLAGSRLVVPAQSQRRLFATTAGNQRVASSSRFGDDEADDADVKIISNRDSSKMRDSDRLVVFLMLNIPWASRVLCCCLLLGLSHKFLLACQKHKNAQF